jgi:hypothetical protein
MGAECAATFLPFILDVINLHLNLPSPFRKARFTENVLRERDGEACTKPSCFAVGFVAAAFFSGGQYFVVRDANRWTIQIDLDAMELTQCMIRQNLT